MSEFTPIREIQPTRSPVILKGEITYSIPDDWKAKLMEAPSDRPVKLRRGDQVIFDGTAGELLARLD